jgi:hypothetical protein
VLCAVIALCLYLEPAQADAHASEDQHAESVVFSGDHIYIHTHDVAPDTNDDTVPDRDSGEAHAHHCGGAHIASLTNGASIYVGEPVALDASFTPEPPDHLSRLSSSLERPPRTSAKS